MTRILMIIAVAGLLCGCASAGHNFDSRKVSDIKKGETTEPQLIAMFGQPNQRGINSESGVTLTWVYSEATANGASFIPVVGIFAGGVNTRTKALVVHLDKTGMVSEYDFSGGNMNASAGGSDFDNNNTNAPARPPKAR